MDSPYWGPASGPAPDVPRRPEFSVRRGRARVACVHGVPGAVEDVVDGAARSVREPLGDDVLERYPRHHGGLHSVVEDDCASPPATQPSLSEAVLLSLPASAGPLSP